MNRLRFLLSLLSSTLSGIFYRYRLEGPVDWQRPYIICPNHTSNLDIAAVIQFIKYDYAFLGKTDMLDHIVTGIFFKAIDIPVNRESKMASFRAFKRAEEYLQKGISLIIFPEGKIADIYPPVLHEFKNGPFRLAIEQNIAILPVTMKNNWKIMWDDGSVYGTRPGICDICVHKPIVTGGLTIADADTLRDEVYRIINNELKR